MKKVKTKDEDNFKHPRNDVLILQFANTALGNRLDHQKRIISQLKLSESSYRAICECYEFFFTSYFSGWKNFLVKLERLNLLVKRQDNTERQTSKFKQLFESMGEMVQVMNKLKECTKDAINPPTLQQQQQVNNANQSGNNAANQNANSYNNTNAINKQRAQTNAAALSDLQKITKQRVESFLKNFENIYTEVAIDCATYGQRMNDAVKSLAQNNETNETMRRLYRENSQLQTKLKEQENYLSKSVPLEITEKEFIINYFGNQNRQFEDLLQKYNEEREISERLSNRIRQKLDYCVGSITAKVGQDPNQILQKLLQSNAANSGNSCNNNAAKENQSSAQSSSSQQNAMEIEDPQGNSNTNVNNANSNCNTQSAMMVENKSEEREGFECICGGYQTDYFSQKYEESLKMLIETQQKLLMNHSLIAVSSATPSLLSATNSLQPTNNLQSAASVPIATVVNGAQQQGNQTPALVSNASVVAAQSADSASQNQPITSSQMIIENPLPIGNNSDTVKISSQNLESHSSQNINGTGSAPLPPLIPMPSLKKSESIQVSNVQLQQPMLVASVSTHQGVNEDICDGKYRIPIDSIAILKKQNDQLIQEKSELEKYIRDMEIEQKNMEDKFFRSGAYQSLAVQTEELLKSTVTMRNQLKEAKQQISEIEKLRFREMSDFIQKYKEEKETLLRRVQEAQEGVYRNQLGEIMRENLSQHFDYKKYTTPLNDQIQKLSDSLTIEREYRQSLEQQKNQLNEQTVTLSKALSDLQTKLSDREQYVLYLESKVGTTGESYVEEKVFKYAKHKELLKYLEKITSDQGQTNQELSKNFKELVAYIKGREEKIGVLEQKLKACEVDKKKLQTNQDQIWKEYENLDKSFEQMKVRCDQYHQEMKLSQEREQGLEYKILEINMQFSKEKQTYTIVMSAEQQKKDNTKAYIDSCEEQNKALIVQNQSLAENLEEYKQLKNQIQQMLEETNIQVLDTQQRLDIITKKYSDTCEKYNELIGNHERVQAKLQAAYELIDSGDTKNTSTEVEVAQLKEKLQNQRLLLQCSCGENLKDTILQKCLHPFCRQCIDKQIRLRQRTCPKCRTPFGQNDIKTLYLNH